MEDKQPFELTDSVMLALESTRVALGKIIGAQGAVRLLSAEISSKLGNVVPRNLGMPRFNQGKTVYFDVKLRNPFGKKPISVSVECSLDHHRNEEKESWSPWVVESVLVTTDGGKMTHFVTGRDLL